VPSNVEKLPLYHWRPGARLLAVGSRDGARFDGALDSAEGRSFRRALSPELLAASQEQAGTDGIAATWSESLRYPQGLRLCAEQARGAFVLVSAGFGDAGLLDELLPRCAACLLMLGAEPGPLAEEILHGAAHVEVLWGLAGPPTSVPLACDEAVAVHLAARRPAAAGAELEDWEDAARALLPSDQPVYDSRQRHSLCSCGATLVWRSGGRSRRDALGADGRCGACALPADFVL